MERKQSARTVASVVLFTNLNRVPEFLIEIALVQKEIMGSNTLHFSQQALRPPFPL